MNVEERFWSKVEQGNDCWIWTGVPNGDGYGNFWNGESWSRAHRWSYEQMVGPIPEGLVIDHLCRVRNCVNPAHLEPVTQSVNFLRGDGPRAAAARNAMRTRCKHGHPLWGENLYVRPSTGHRYCRTCQRSKLREFRKRKLEATR